jgi:hypothetical protein
MGDARSTRNSGEQWTDEEVQQLRELADGNTPLSPVTADLAEAEEWFDVLPAAMGVEGLVHVPNSSFGPAFARRQRNTARSRGRLTHWTPCLSPTPWRGGRSVGVWP